MPFSNYQRQRILESVFQGVEYVNDATMYVALSKTSIGPLDAGADLEEADYEGYARVSVLSDSGSWELSFDGDQISNLLAIQFPQVISGLNTITHFALLDSSEIGTGNVLAYGNLQVPAYIEPSDDPYFDVGTLYLSLRD